VRSGLAILEASIDVRVDEAGVFLDTPPTFKWVQDSVRAQQLSAVVVAAIFPDALIMLPAKTMHAIARGCARLSLRLADRMDIMVALLLETATPIIIVSVRMHTTGTIPLGEIHVALFLAE
jgi:hypothetical protein